MLEGIHSYPRPRGSRHSLAVRHAFAPGAVGQSHQSNILFYSYSSSRLRLPEGAIENANWYNNQTPENVKTHGQGARSARRTQCTFLSRSSVKHAGLKAELQGISRRGRSRRGSKGNLPWVRARPTELIHWTKQHERHAPPFNDPILFSPSRRSLASGPGATGPPVTMQNRTCPTDLKLFCLIL